MFMMIFIMAFAGMYIEMRIVNSCSPLGNLLEKTRVGALVFSLGLSAGLGVLFGATGLIVFASGVLSTLMIQPWYAMRRNGTLDTVRVFRANANVKYGEAKAKFNANKDLYARRAHQLWTGVVFVTKVVTFPFVAIGALLDFIDKTMTRFGK